MNNLVIARFDEDLDWITRVPGQFRIFVYNKGEPITTTAVINRATVIADRPNRGREAETYLHHLLTTTPDGPGHTVFSQGQPFDHSPDFIEILAASARWSAIQPLTCRWQKGLNLPPIPPASLMERWHATEPGVLSIRPELFSLMTWGPLHFHDVGPIRTGVVYRDFYKLAPGTNLASHFLDLCHLDRQAGQAARHVVGSFAYGAIFAVANALIGDVPSVSLERMHALALETGVSYGHIFERLWLHIFGADFLLPVSRAGLLDQDNATSLA